MTDYELPYSYDTGFSLFTRVQLIALPVDPKAELVLWHKAILNSTDTIVEGGFVVGVYAGYLSVKASSGVWVPTPVAISPGVAYNILVRYSITGQWAITVGDMMYYLTEPIAQELPLHELYLGGTFTTNNSQWPWNGSIWNIAVNCEGPLILPNTFSPDLNRKGVQPYVGNRLIARFDSPIVALQGALHLTTSVYGGLNDRTFILRNSTDISNVVIQGDTLIYNLPYNFTYDVRYEVSIDAGALRRVSDLGTYDGLLFYGTGKGQWQFYVSEEYYIDKPPLCAGQPCAACEACSYVQTRPSGDREYMCLIPQATGLMKIVQRINVEMYPTTLCP